MPKKGYNWVEGETPPSIFPHSLAKHRILRDYLISYVRVLAADPRIDKLSLTLVDGFAGGGLYLKDGTNEPHYGSPVLMLQAIQEAEFQINCARTKRFKVDSRFFFIDNDKDNLRFLKLTLRQEGYGDRIDQDIVLLHKNFADCVGDIVAWVVARKGGCRAIFLLDQYGYTDVPFSKIREIFTYLPGAEVILTFAVDALIDYLADTKVCKEILSKVGIAHHIDWRRIEVLKQTNQWRFTIQSQLIDALLAETGAKFHNPFFIHSPESHRDYWLVHLSMHLRARDVMNQLHWDNHTYFRHYGRPGLNMLGYDPDRDEDLTKLISLDFGFDDNAHTRSLEALSNELPIRIFEMPDGQTFAQLVTSTCNETPASTKIFKEVLGFQLARREIEVRSPKGERRRKGQRIMPTDIIVPARQHYFVY